jgi:Tfp pilus assembly protein PilO
MASLSNQYEQLSPITRLGIAMLLIALCGWYSWDEFIVPKQEALLVKQDELDKISNELKDSNTLVSPVSMEEELNKANREYKKMIELLPDEPAVEKILNDFASLSRLSGVEIREFMPMTLPPGQANMAGGITPGVNTVVNYTTQPSSTLPINTIGVDEDTNSITISVKLQGTFSSMVSFMDMAMSLPRVIRIQDFEIIHEERELKLVQRPKLSFTGKFTAYFQRGLGADKTAVAEKKAEPESPVNNISTTPLVDVNEVLDKSFSAKGSAGP